MNHSEESAVFESLLSLCSTMALQGYRLSRFSCHLHGVVQQPPVSGVAVGDVATLWRDKAVLCALTCWLNSLVTNCEDGTVTRRQTPSIEDESSVAYPGIFSGGGGGCQQIQLRTEDRENGDLGASSPLVRGSGGSCNLVQEISFHMVTFSSFLVL